MKRLKHVMPRSDGAWVTKDKRCVSDEGADPVGDEAIVAQSAPPMTLPARTVARKAPFSKNDALHDAATSSCAALLVLYGSCSPTGSLSR